MGDATHLCQKGKSNTEQFKNASIYNLVLKLIPKKLKNKNYVSRLMIQVTKHKTHSK